MRSEGLGVACCTVARLIKSLDIEGIIDSNPPRTTFPGKKQPCQLDKVNRQFRVPVPKHPSGRTVEAGPSVRPLARKDCSSTLSSVQALE